MPLDSRATACIRGFKFLGGLISCTNPHAQYIYLFIFSISIATLKLKFLTELECENVTIFHRQIKSSIFL